jgi:hypothetical protein
MENWREFLLTEANSSGTVSKLIKLDNDAKILVQNAIKDLESEHSTQITADHLKKVMPTSAYRYGSPGYKAAKAQHKRAFKVPLLRAIKKKIGDIHVKLEKQYNHAISAMLKQKPSRTQYTGGSFDAMILAFFALEKGLKPSNVYGNRFLLKTKVDPFVALEAKSTKQAAAAAAAFKGNFMVYTLVRGFLPDGWEKASVNVVRICCHLLREKFGSSGITFMGANIMTPSYRFIMEFISGQMAAHIKGTLAAAVDSPMDSLKYLKFHGGDDIFQSVVEWINSNTAPTLEQVITKINEVLEDMATKGFRGHAIYKQFVSSKKMILLVLGK